MLEGNLIKDMNIKTSFSHRNHEPEVGVLYIVGTPIGNLSDISSRALKILSNVSFIACEDTRETKKILNKFKIKNNLVSFNKNNAFKKIPVIIKDLNEGKSIALVSDAGMPSICDPGENLVKNAKLNKIDVICIPGPCAAITALVSSGFPTSSFIFKGFLPRKKTEREELLKEISKNHETTVLYESPKRLKRLLEELKEYCGGEREIEISRELTKKFEEHIGRDINNVLKHFEDKDIIGEITVVIRGIDQSKTPEFDELSLRKELYELREAGLSLSSASKYLAKKKNLPKSIIYKLH